MKPALYILYNNKGVKVMAVNAALSFNRMFVRDAGWKIGGLDEQVSNSIGLLPSSGSVSSLHHKIELVP